MGFGKRMNEGGKPILTISGEIDHVGSVRLIQPFHLSRSARP